MLLTQIPILIPNTGATVSINSNSIADYYLLFPTTGSPITLISNFTISLASTPLDGTRIEFEIPAAQFTLGGNIFTIQGNAIPQYQLTTGGRFILTWSNSGMLEFDYAPNLVNTISGAIITNNTLALTSLTGLNSAHIIVGNSSNVATSIVPTGDLTLSNVGLFTINNAAVTNIKINPGSNNSAKVTNSSGVISDIILATNQYLGNIGSGIQAVTLSPSGLNSVAWTLTGNTGTNSNNNFIGTIDNVSLRFRVNNSNAGRIDNNAGNTALGYQSFNAFTGVSNTTTAIGYQSLFNNSGGVGNNTAVGGLTLPTLITGINNTALGTNADVATSTTNNAISIGVSAVASTNQIAIPNTITSMNFSGVITALLGALPSYANNTAAVAGGLVVGQLFVTTNASGQTQGIVCQRY